MVFQFQSFPSSTVAALKVRFQDFMDQEAYEHGAGDYSGTLATKRSEGLVVIQTKTYFSSDDAIDALMATCTRRGPAIAVPVRILVPQARNRLRMLYSRIQVKKVNLLQETNIGIPERRKELYQQGLDRVASRSKSQHKTCTKCRSTINTMYLTVDRAHCPVCSYEDLLLTFDLKQAKRRLNHRAQDIKNNIKELQADIDNLTANSEADGHHWLVGGLCSS